MADFLEKLDGAMSIGTRLKEIDLSYELFYNKKTKRIEVYSCKNGARSLAFVSPFGLDVDARLIRFARRTRSERAADIIKEIEEDNKKLIEKSQKEEIERALIYKKLKLKN